MEILPVDLEHGEDEEHQAQGEHFLHHVGGEGEKSG